MPFENSDSPTPGEVLENSDSPESVTLELMFLVSHHFFMNLNCVSLPEWKLSTNYLKWNCLTSHSPCILRSVFLSLLLSHTPHLDSYQILFQQNRISTKNLFVFCLLLFLIYCLSFDYYHLSTEVLASYSSCGISSHFNVFCALLFIFFYNIFSKLVN